MGGRQQRIALWVVAGVAVFALLFGLSQYRQARRLSLQAEASRQRAVFNLISHVENIEGSLAKARISSTNAQQTVFLTNCWSHSQAAQENISLMGMTTIDMSTMQRFIAQVGDYSMVLSQKLARGDTVTQEEWGELTRLESSIQDLARALAETGMSAISASASTTRSTFGFLSGSILQLSAGPSDETWLRGFSEIDSLIQSVPSPAYDGPFSDRSLASRPIASPGPVISQDEAIRKAFEFLGSWEQFESVRVENVEGALPAFLVTGKRADESEVTISVVRAGGSILWAIDKRPIASAGIDVESARKAALEFLAARSIGSVKETGWRKAGTQSGRIVFAFAATEVLGEGPRAQEVILYPDLIKVEVALDSGGVVGFDQTAYLTNHIDRSLKTPLFSEREAKEALKGGIETKAPRLTVIPLVGAREILAWEFEAKHQNDTYLVYINAMTGKEEMILKMVIDENGSLTM